MEKPKRPHYQARGGIEPIEFIKSNNMDFLEGNVIKYIYRYPFEQRGAETLRKAKQYLEWLIERAEKQDTLINEPTFICKGCGVHMTRRQAREFNVCPYCATKIP